MKKKFHVETMKCYKSNIECFDENGDNKTINLDGLYGYFTEREWRFSLLDDFDSESVNKIIEELYTMGVIDGDKE